MGGSPSKLDLTKAEHDQAIEKRRMALLEKANAQAEKEMVHIKISAPRDEAQETGSYTYCSPYVTQQEALDTECEGPTHSSGVSYMLQTRARLGNVFLNPVQHVHLHAAMTGNAEKLIKHGQCTIKIPEGALLHDIETTFTTMLSEKPQEDVHRLTPILKCEPDGLKFAKPVEITLPTCVRNLADLPVTVTVRHRSETGKWKVLTELSLDKNTQSFTFCTNHFSRFDVIILTAQIYLGLAKEKAIVVAVPPREEETVTELVASVLICNNIEQAREVKHLNVVYGTTFLMDSSEEEHRIEVAGYGHVNIDPQDILVRGVWHSSQDVSQFKMTSERNWKQETTRLNILLHSVTLDKVKVDKHFYLERHHFIFGAPVDVSNEDYKSNYLIQQRNDSATCAFCEYQLRMCNKLFRLLHLEPMLNYWLQKICAKVSNVAIKEKCLELVPEYIEKFFNWFQAFTGNPSASCRTLGMCSQSQILKEDLEAPMKLRGLFMNADANGNWTEKML